MTAEVSVPTTLRLPRKHAQDWLGRYDGPDEGEHDADQAAVSARTVTLTLGPAALSDLISDALYYSEEMSPDNTGDVDYRPPARTLLRALDRLGVTYTRRQFSITLT